MRCAIYCRLSREDEDKHTESESIQNQKAILLSYAGQQGWEVIELYCDEDYSGADRSRPDFNRMLLDARAGRFDLILCKTQSRFTRDMELVERYIHGLFPVWGIRFVAIADHVDTSLRGNKKARQINGLVNEWYLEDLSENIRMVLNHKRRQGQYIGGFPLYGYRRHPTEKGRLTVDPEAAHVVRQIFRLALEGYGKQQIATLLNQEGVPNPSRYKREQGSSYRNGSTRDLHGPWSRASVGRILHNEMYLGIMVQGTHRKLNFKSDKLLSVPKNEWFRVEGTHEAIVDLETFAAVQALHRMRSKSDGTGEVHPLAGLVRCKGCGRAMEKNSYQYQGKHYRYLRCPNRTGEGGTAGCHCSIQMDDLLSLVEKQVKQYCSDWYQPSGPASLARKAGPLFSLTPAEGTLSPLQICLRTRIAALEQLYLDQVSGLVTRQQFQDLAAAISEEIEALRQRIRAASNLPPPTSASQEALSPNPPSFLEAGVPPRPLLLRLIRQIFIGEKERSGKTQSVEIQWNF